MMNNGSEGQLGKIANAESNNQVEATSSKISKREEISQRLRSFGGLFVEGENAVLPRFREISRSAIDRALHVFAKIDIPEVSEAEELSPKKDMDTQLLELWGLRDAGDEAVLSRMMELYQEYKDNRIKYPGLKSGYSSWKDIAPSTISNLRALAWLTMDDPTKFDDVLKEKGEWREGDFILGDSNRYNPASANTISAFCRALDLSIGVGGKNKTTLLDIASTDKSAQHRYFRRPRNPEGPKFDRGFDGEISDEFIPILRRTLVLVNAGITSNKEVLYKTLSNVGLSINSKSTDWTNAALYLLYLHQKTGLIYRPEFSGTVARLRDVMMSPYSDDIEGKMRMAQELPDRYGFDFLYDKKFWDIKEEENTMESDTPDILGVDLRPIRSKASELRRLGPRQKFNAASSIARSASRNIGLSDEDSRKAKIYRDVTRDKEESNEAERKRRRLTTQYLEVVDKTVGAVFPQTDQEVPLSDEVLIRKGLELFLGTFVDHPELSPVSKAFIQRIVRNEGIPPEDDYQLNMKAIMKDPFLSSAIKYLSDQENYKKYTELSKSESSDAELLTNIEFITRYMAYKILSLTGTEREGSDFILHQLDTDDPQDLEELCRPRINMLEGIQERDSEREKRFIRKAIKGYNDQGFEVVEDSETDISEGNRSARESLMEMIGRISEKVSETGRLLKEKKYDTGERLAMSLALLGVAGGIILSNPSVREYVDVPSKVLNLIAPINPLHDEASIEADGENIGQKHEKTDKVTSKTTYDFPDRYASLSVERMNSTRERKVVGQVVNSNERYDGHPLGFMPEIVGGLEYIEAERPLSPTTITQEEIINKYSDYDGLVVKTILLPGERTIPIGRRSLKEVFVEGNLEGARLQEDSSQSITNVGETEVVVYEVLSPEEDARIREVEHMRVEAYDLNDDLQASRELLSSLNPDSPIAQVYSSMISNIEIAIQNNSSREEISKVIEEELRIFERNFVNQQSYSLDFRFNSDTVSQQLSLTPEQGYDCNTAAILLLEILQSFGVKAGTVSGVNVTDFGGQAWTDNFGHVRVLVGTPDGKVLEVDFTPPAVPGKTTEETIRKLQPVAPESPPEDAKYTAPIQPIIEIEESEAPMTEKIPDSHQPEIALTITSLLALIGKYHNRNRPKNRNIDQLATVQKEAETSGPGELDIRTNCINDILKLFVPLSVSAQGEGSDELRKQATGLLYAAFSVDDVDHLGRLYRLTQNALELGSNRYPINSSRTAMLEELNSIIEKYRQRMLEDEIKEGLGGRTMPSRMYLLERFLIDNGWNDSK